MESKGRRDESTFSKAQGKKMDAKTLTGVCFDRVGFGLGTFGFLPIPNRSDFIPIIVTCRRLDRFLNSVCCPVRTGVSK